MTFLEFFDALVGCAQVYVTESVVKDPTTPRPSTTMTQGGQTIMSVTGSASQASGVSVLSLTCIDNYTTNWIEGILFLV